MNATKQGVTFAAHTATIDGARIYYRTGGTGPVLILLHGYAQTSRMWNRIMPELAKRFTLIVPDLPGIGDSDIPANGLDMKTAQLSKRRLTMPILAIGGERSNGVALGQQIKLVGTNVKVVVLRNTGHWLLDENPQETREALLRFL